MRFRFSSDELQIFFEWVPDFLWMGSRCWDCSEADTYGPMCGSHIGCSYWQPLPSHFICADNGNGECMAGMNTQSLWYPCKATAGTIPIIFQPFLHCYHLWIIGDFWSHSEPYIRYFSKIFGTKMKCFRNPIIHFSKKNSISKYLIGFRIR